MSTINNNSSISALQQSINSTTTPDDASQNDLDQDAFMQLLIAQMKNQDPTEPVDASQQLVQLAQFTQVESLDKINAQMENLVAAQTSSQALQASALVGKSVQVNTSQFDYQGGAVSGTIDLANTTGNLTISVQDAWGREIDTIEMGQEAAGEIDFSWAGSDSRGPHRFVATAAEVNGETYAVPLYLNANVNSVSLADNNTTLNVSGVGPVALADVRSITENP